MSNQDSSKRTPITDLLAVAYALATYLKEAGHMPYPEDDPELGPHGHCLTCLLVMDADAAIAKATKGGAGEQESPSTTQ